MLQNHSFKAGPWVAHKQGKYSGFVDFSNDSSTTLWVKGKHGLVKQYHISNYDLYKMGDHLLPDELYELIDLALAMGDNDWFVSLWGRMMKAKERTE